MTKILFHSLNVIDPSVLTVTSANENPDWPVENLQSEQRSESFRTVPATDLTMTIAHQGSVAADSLILFDHNLPSGSVIKIERDTDTTPPHPFTEFAVWNAGPIIHRFTQNIYPFTLLHLVVPSAQVIEIGRAILGAPKTPNINYSWGYRKRRVDYSEPVKSTGHQVFTNLKRKVWEYEISFRCKTADIAILEAFFEDCGIGKHLAISFAHDANPNTELKYGMILTPLEYSRNAPDYYTVSTIVFREAT